MYCEEKNCCQFLVLFTKQRDGTLSMFSNRIWHALKKGKTFSYSTYTVIKKSFHTWLQPKCLFFQNAARQQLKSATGRGTPVWDAEAQVRRKYMSTNITIFYVHLVYPQLLKLTRACIHVICKACIIPPHTIRILKRMLVFIGLLTQ